MAIDTVQKRMSAINIAGPWRGAMVSAASPGFTAANRAAAAYMYGLAAEEPTRVTLVARNNIIPGFHKHPTIRLASGGIGNIRVV